MRIGIDIGGTHTDGVLIDGDRLIAAAKTPTLGDNLLESISQVLRSILAGQDPKKVKTLNLSTTLNTNAIVTGRIDPVGVLVTGGPGIAPETYRIGEHYHLIPGSLDHLGTETTPLDMGRLDDAVADCSGKGIRTFAVVGKFSPRNPMQENRIRAQLRDRADFVSLGHLISGQLNFGRRIHTAYYNSAVWRAFRVFSTALMNSLQGFDIQAEINILKADGGTMPLSRALENPVQSIFSGPAASVMGILAMAPTDSDVLMLDIGGTTTDIALFAAGQPLLEREGISIDGRPTLVRAIHVESIGIGGDSLIQVEQGSVLVGPHRLGPCLAMGGSAPALMDALNVLGLVEFGKSRNSVMGIEELANRHGLSAQQLAKDAVDTAVNAISTRIDGLITRMNSKPVYTIQEILEDRPISPSKLIVIGGPAHVFRDLLQTSLGMEVVIPPLHGVANAVGAALTRSTTQLVLTADTARGKVSIPSLEIFRPVPKSYSLETAVDEAKSLLMSDLEQAGVRISPEEVQIIQADSLNIVEDFYTTGRNIRVVVQIQPSVTVQLDMTKADISIKNQI
jgi:N-methylhydantoinase A/oxoprolinase/acetone carboxylase beta subunit